VFPSRPARRKTYSSPGVSRSDREIGLVTLGFAGAIAACGVLACASVPGFAFRRAAPTVTPTVTPPVTPTVPTTDQRPAPESQPTLLADAELFGVIDPTAPLYPPPPAPPVEPSTELAGAAAVEIAAR